MSQADIVWAGFLVEKEGDVKLLLERMRSMREQDGFYLLPVDRRAMVEFADASIAYRAILVRDPESRELPEAGDRLDRAIKLLGVESLDYGS